MSTHGRCTDFPDHVFRAYDVRGKAGSELSGELAYALGRAFVTHLNNAHGRAHIIAAGRDNRPSSPALHAAFCDGVASMGSVVHDIGLASTPLVGFAVTRHSLDGGVCITGSHNSPSRNGFKLDARDALPLAGDDIQHLRLLMHSDDGAVSPPGDIATLDVLNEYLDAVAALVTITRPLRVVVDAGNAVMGLIAPPLFQRLGCEVVCLFCDLDSSFPNHVPNPENPANLGSLQKEVVKQRADLGIAFDADGDRLGVVDEIGAVFAPERILMALARDHLSRHSGASVLVDVKSSRTVLKDIRTHGGIPVLTPSGHSLIRRRMRKTGIELAGEYSGHFFVAESFYDTSDALVAATRLAALLSSSETPLSRMLGDLPQRFSSGLVELPAKEHTKRQLVATVGAQLSTRYPVIDIDGYRVETPDGWALIRASNTGPRLTLRFEADSPDRLRQIQSEVMGLLSEVETRVAGEAATRQ